MFVQHSNGLISCFVENTLDGGDKREEEGVQCEGNVIGLDCAIVLREKGDEVEHGVAEKSCQVEGDKGEGQAFDCFGSVVEVDLWVEGSTPARKVEPAKDGREDH